MTSCSSVATVATVAVDVGGLCALHQTMRALHDLVHAPPTVGTLAAARGLSVSMLRRLCAVSAMPVVRAEASVMALA